MTSGWLRRSIAARSAVVILTLVCALQLGFLGVTVPLAEQRETAEQLARLNDLLDTVQRTVSIACYLSDRQLAGEVALGLLSNPTVSQVTITAAGARLAASSRAGVDAGISGGAPVPGTLRRRVASPFAPAEVVGEIVLVPDAAAIERSVGHASWPTALLLAAQILVIGLGVSLVVTGLIVRPIAGISARLHELRAETGQKLDTPRGNEQDEIGRLVRDVNAMADSLVRILAEERELRLQREIEERKFRAIFEHADTGIFLADEDGRIGSCNPAFMRLFGLSQSGAPGGPGQLFADLVGEHGDTTDALFASVLAGRTSASRDMKLAGAAGIPTRWINVVLTPIENRRVQGVVNDVTERKRAEEAAQELAATDLLTGLPNRLGFERRLDQMLDAFYRDPQHRFSLLIIDLDRFKQVNDTYGHKAGDDVLVAVARAMKDALRKTDFVGRLGGDEFVALLDSTVQRDVIARIAQKIIDAINLPIPLDGGSIARVGASAGAAILAENGPGRDELMRRADEAMYRAKQAGGNACRLFEERLAA